MRAIVATPQQFVHVFCLRASLGYCTALSVQSRMLTVALNGVILAAPKTVVTYIVRCDMKARVIVGLVMLVSAAAASCTSTEVTAPLVASSASATFAMGGGPPSDPCADPKKQECILTGRFTGGGGQLVTIGQIYVTRGFTLHCDILLSNNLEINWPGNKWHTDKPFTAVACLDDPAINPDPPPAPVDTYVGDGSGSLNGVGGARARIVLKDSGERGGVNDFASIQVWDANGVLVLDLPLSPLTNGNIQAHFDQPHR